MKTEWSWESKNGVWTVEVDLLAMFMFGFGFTFSTWTGFLALPFLLVLFDGREIGRKA